MLLRCNFFEHLLCIRGIKSKDAYRTCYAYMYRACYAYIYRERACYALAISPSQAFMKYFSSFTHGELVVQRAAEGAQESLVSHCSVPFRWERMFGTYVTVKNIVEQSSHPFFWGASRRSTRQIPCGTRITNVDRYNLKVCLSEVLLIYLGHP